MNLILKIVGGNTTIPVILCDENDNVQISRNIEVPDKNADVFLAKKIKEFKSKKQVIPIDLDDGTFQYIYYDDSILLKRLFIYPYAQLSIVFIFILIAFVALSSTKKAEQNKVWVGLSKETAHQLGTPISSLVAWVEYLRTKEIDVSLLNEMEKDVKRLEIIAERFSKIGSNPVATPVNINHSIQSTLDYMQTRISSKVKLHTHLPEELVLVSINDSLFAWVLENLIKNAVDAMSGQGEITFQAGVKNENVFIDITDTGKGIHKSRFKTIFNPGYTTKARGWGLGLSLVKRIIESYHDGKIFVKSSEVGKGTTFRIELRKYKG
jgi:signal transduction histidine kinase